MNSSYRSKVSRGSDISRKNVLMTDVRTWMWKSLNMTFSGSERNATRMDKLYMWLPKHLAEAGQIVISDRSIDVGPFQFLRCSFRQRLLIHEVDMIAKHAYPNHWHYCNGIEFPILEPDHEWCSWIEHPNPNTANISRSRWYCGNLALPHNKHNIYSFRLAVCCSQKVACLVGAHRKSHA